MNEAGISGDCVYELAGEVNKMRQVKELICEAFDLDSPEQLSRSLHFDKSIARGACIYSVHLDNKKERKIAAEDYEIEDEAT